MDFDTGNRGSASFFAVAPDLVIATGHTFANFVIEVNRLDQFESGIVVGMNSFTETILPI